jgi:hypothetical protein
LGLRGHVDVGYASRMMANASGFSHPGVDHNYGMHAMAAFEKVLQLLQLNRRGPSANPLRSIVPVRWVEAAEPQRPEETRRRRSARVRTRVTG